MSFHFPKEYSRFIEKLVPNGDGTITAYVKIKNKSFNITVPWDPANKDFNGVVEKVKAHILKQNK